MAGLPKNNKHITEYDADIRKHTAALKKLERAQTEQVQSAQKGIASVNTASESSIPILGKLAAGAIAIGAAYKTAQSSLASYHEESRLRHAAAAADMDRLRAATQGLVPDLELLRLAAKTMNGDLKISQKDLEAVAKHAIRLRNDGADLTEVLNELTKAITEGSVDGLKKFQIHLKAGSNAAETQRAVIKLATESVQKYGEASSIAGDESRRALVDVSNATNNLSVEMGKLASSMAPVIARMARIAAFAIKNNPVRGFKLAGQLAAAPFSDSAADAVFQSSGPGSSTNIDARIAQLEAAGNPAHLGELNALRRKRIARDGPPITVAPEAPVPPPEPPKLAGGGSRREIVGAPVTSTLDPLTRAQLGLSNRGAVEVRHADLRGIDSVSSFSGAIAAPIGLGGIATADGGIGAEEIDRAKEALLRADPVLSRMAEGFSMLGQGATAAFTAIVTGSEGAGKAMTKALGQSVLAKAQDAFATSLHSLGMGLWQLASGNPQAAASFAAAAKNAAVAATLGVLANKMLGGGGAIGGGGGGQFSAGGAGAKGNQGGGPRTIIIGDDFSETDPRTRSRRMRRILDRTNREDGGRSGPVVFE